MEEFKLTIAEFQEVRKAYGEVMVDVVLDSIGFPKVPNGFTRFTAWRQPVAGDKFLGWFGLDSCKYDFEYSGPRLILEPKPKRYRFVCDDPTPQLVKRGDWVTQTRPGEAGSINGYLFVEVVVDYREEDPRLVFRREEIPQ